jgi:hypothetical protein
MEILKSPENLFLIENGRDKLTLSMDILRHRPNNSKQ